ncbi:hemerythrin domain-containing protein [Chryseobacterium suipulveris]|uniref:Hemerythrin domain-containing protein n=1 Tax=Chryseobacterium suipulveris TaxID=2929800 RepID=A0ABY4BP59_9FLAO|nr:hemerythrin domain-containing protein [Chryseobacterium suipulveris]UOE40962.1 hemerythrin domain-containing protein [Chryseobacterium suipulveris]
MGITDAKSLTKMEKKPIKRNENLVPVSREHHATLLFCWKLRNGVKMEIEPERITKYMNWFWKHHLEHHFDTEEKLLFIDHNDEMVKKGLEEHQRILAKINEINLRTEEKSYPLYHELADLVDQHTRYEERELFPYLEEKFSDQKLDEIGKTLHSEEHTALENYDDEFWVKEK